ncbi:MAG: DNA polymerase [Candidatus Pacebacteria bacterium]|nr:DNA polymerase [Candidatus Paceibacterota bacterium]
MKKKETAKSPTLVLLDTHAILHRAYHAIPDFASSKGEPTGGLYGLALMLIGIANELKPDYIVAAYDLPGPTYRHDAYKAYKAGRPKTAPELVAQIKRSHDLIAAFNIPEYSVPGFEADDILGTIVEQVEKKKIDADVIIASGDMDTMQLIDDDHVRVYTLKKGIKDTIIYNEKAVIARFGFGPKLIPDYKGLRGDPSDNIIGIAGIGEKTATDLMTNFGSVEDIYKILEKDKNGEKKLLAAGIKARIIELLKNGKEEAMFSKMLATIRRDAPIDFNLPAKKWREDFDFAKIETLFKELEFRTLGNRVKAVVEGKVESGKSIKFIKSKVEGKSGDKKEKTADLEYDEELPVKKEKKKAIESPVPQEVLRPIAVGAWLLDSNYTGPTYEDVLSITNAKDWDEAKKVVVEEIKSRGLSRVYDDIELPLIPVLDAMKERGVKIDRAYMEKLSKEYNGKIHELEKGIYQLAGEEFNINSPKQLGDILFDKLQLSAPRMKKTAGGARSTKESELQKLSEHEIVKKILDYRQLAKLVGTYIDAIPPLLDGNDRLHATFDQTGAVTGRMSSHDPGLQNIPIQTEEGRRIRDAFIAEKGFSLVSLDYSQIELRIAAFLANDEEFMKIFKGGRDVHREVAAKVFGVKAEEVTPDMRRKAKVINFGVMYGMGVNALRQNLGGTRPEAQEFYNHYFQAFSGLARYLDSVKAEAKRKGYTETLFGRRRYFGDISSPIPFIRAAAERMAINAPIQGTEADIVKLAMVKIFEYIKANKLEDSVYLLLQVHDELVLEIQDRILDKVVPDIQKIMETVVSLDETKGVPLAVGVHIGKNWGKG